MKEGHDGPVEISDIYNSASYQSTGNKHDHVQDHWALFHFNSM